METIIQSVIESKKILGLPLKRQLTKKEVRNAYRKRILETHPDKSKQTSNEEFTNVVNSYNCLLEHLNNNNNNIQLKTFQTFTKPKLYRYPVRKQFNVHQKEENIDVFKPEIVKTAIYIHKVHDKTITVTLQDVYYGYKKPKIYVDDDWKDRWTIKTTVSIPCLDCLEKKCKIHTSLHNYDIDISSFCKFQAGSLQGQILKIEYLCDSSLDFSNSASNDLRLLPKEQEHENTPRNQFMNNYWKDKKQILRYLIQIDVKLNIIEHPKMNFTVISPIVTWDKSLRTSNYIYIEDFEKLSDDSKYTILKRSADLYYNVDIPLHHGIYGFILSFQHFDEPNSIQISSSGQNCITGDDLQMKISSLGMPIPDIGNMKTEKEKYGDLIIKFNIMMPTSYNYQKKEDVLHVKSILEKTLCYGKKNSIDKNTLFKAKLNSGIPLSSNDRKRIKEDEENTHTTKKRKLLNV